MLSRRTFVGSALAAPLASALPMWAAPAGAQGGPARQRQAPFLLGLHVPDSTVTTGLPAAEAQIGRRADVVLMFAILDSTLPVATLASLMDQGYEVVLCVEWWDRSRNPRDARYSLAEIARGAHDAAAARLWRDIATLPRPLHMRPLHEGNGDWYPWGTYTGTNKVAEFAPAFRRIASQAWDVAGRDKVRIQWCMNRKNGRDRPDPLAAFYPGDEFVDEFAINGYNRPEYSASVSFEDIFRPAYNQMKALSVTTPLWIGETASTERRGDKAAWIDGLLRTVRTTMVLDCVTWFHQQVNPSSGLPRDWRFDSSAASLDAFRRLAAVDRGVTSP